MKSFLIAAVLGLFLAGPGSAATAKFTDFDDFQAAAGTLQGEGFGSFTRGMSLAGTQNFGPFTTTLKSVITDSRFNVVGGPDSLNRHGMTGTNLQVGLLGGETFTFTFKTAITAFGASFANVNDRRLRSFFSYGEEDAMEDVGDWLPVVRRLGTRFFGIVSDTPFDTVTITGGLFSEGLGIDNLVWAEARTPTPVPLPASAVLLLAAVLAMGAIGRRRARA